MKDRERQSVKVFIDLLADFEQLKYIFEYGFYWDDETAELITNKTSQSFRELSDILSDEVLANCATISWTESIPKGAARKSNRRMVFQNHYRLTQNRWIQDLYGSYGAYNSWYARDYIVNCKRTDGNFGCEKERKCTYYRICQINQETDVFLKLSQGICATTDGFCEKDLSNVKFLRRYKDVIVSTEGRFELKENPWTFEVMTRKSLISSQEEYGRFLEMLNFLSEFTPLSVLGGNFLRRLPDVREDTAPVILVRNLPLDYGLEQEFIYRTLYAIVHGYSIQYNGEEYAPQQICYKERGFSGLEENLYLHAKSTNTGKMKWLRLGEGAYIEIGKKCKYFRDESGTDEEEQEELIEVEFLYNNQTEYLLERRKKGWGDAIIETLDHIRVLEMDSPYDSGKREWNVDKVTYKIRRCDIPGFQTFIRSFGDFARMRNQTKMEKREQKFFPIRKAKNRELQSLLSLYNSKKLAENASRPLPPLKEEEGWLLFVLKHYPGMCQMFLERKTLERIEGELASQKFTWLWEEWYDDRRRVLDLSEHKAPKYREILNAVRKGMVLQYEFNRRNVSIVPYALEYDFVNHLTGHEQEPLDVMCYSLNEKRNIRIRYKKIYTKQKCSFDELEFTDLDKLYHILAYAVRCAIEGRTEIWDKAEGLLELLWKTDSRGGDNYNRCIRKRWKKERDYEAIYNQLECRLKEIGQEQIDFLENAFGYWVQAPKISESWMQRQYRSVLIACFEEACRRLFSQRIGKKIHSYMECIEKKELERLIRGDDLDGVINEIAFYNEKLKNDRISFVLKEEYFGQISQVYQLFKEFVCAGQLLRDGRLQFTVSFESFYYRKIHMALMALGDWIEELEPEETAAIIEKRKKNMEEYNG